ncbi:MAG: META domain-containing protein [Niabella sp.]
MKKSILVLAMAVAIMACNDNATKDSTENATAGQTTEAIKTTSDGLFANEWTLAELNGKTIVLDATFPGKPSLGFEKEGSKFFGNGGCNKFGGVLELKDGDSIKLLNIAATQMACPNLEVETSYFEALRNAQTYQIVGDTLILNSAQASPLAKFGKTVQ